MINMSEQLTEIDALVKGREPSQALDKINELKKELYEIPSDLLRLEALSLSGLGRHNEALKSIEDALVSSKDIFDWYLGGELSLILGDMNKSILYLSKAITLSEERNSSYFIDTCYLMRAYAYIELRELESATADIDKVDPDEAVTWLPVGVLSRDTLAEKLP